MGAPSLLRPDPQNRSAAGSRVGASPGRRNVFNSLPFSLLSRQAAWGGWAFAQRGRTAPQEVGAPREAPIFRNPTTGSHCPACVPCLSNNLWRQAFTYRLKGIENTDMNTQPRFIKYLREAKTMKVSTKLNKWMS